MVSITIEVVVTRVMLLLALVLCFVVIGLSWAIVPQISVTPSAPLVERDPKTCFRLVYDNPVVSQDPGSGGGGSGVI